MPSYVIKRIDGEHHEEKTLGSVEELEKQVAEYKKLDAGKTAADEPDESGDEGDEGDGGTDDGEGEGGEA